MVLNKLWNYLSSVCIVKVDAPFSGCSFLVGFISRTSHDHLSFPIYSFPYLSGCFQLSSGKLSAVNPSVIMAHYTIDLRSRAFRMLLLMMSLTHVFVPVYAFYLFKWMVQGNIFKDIFAVSFIVFNSGNVIEKISFFCYYFFVLINHWMTEIAAI